MTSLGVWSCQYRELRPIKFGGPQAAAQKGDTAGGSKGQPAVDEEQGSIRGGRRGRGRDGAGDYEMVGMNGESSK